MPRRIEEAREDEFPGGAGDGRLGCVIHGWREAVDREGEAAKSL